MILTLFNPAWWSAVAMARLEDRTQAHSAALQPSALKLSANAVKFTDPMGTMVLSQACRPSRLMDS